LSFSAEFGIPDVTTDYQELRARVQELINAVELAHHERRWVDLPLA
jgi:hypothetical protein